ncbi:flagellar biosynthesis protein FlgA [Bosea sp. (in: a-proteobacteria)]|uniref:flagellar biosynthesis protein FlgA n=1 Tax=Bosea sp. (in: a-proteobacteria) TaxID=1871050 RepID=UPI00273623DD|nr:flagellar biosynthesis protein FlgA [Bosea sp. (in: a-proteobacteria)]
MNLEEILRLRRQNTVMTVSAGLVGAGEFGACFIAQARRTPHFATRAICDRDLGRARTAALTGGFSDGDLARCGSEGEALAAIERGQVALVADAEMMARLPIDVVVEATGDPEGAARTALAAIRNRRHVVMVTKETEVVIGPILAELARRQGVVHTPVDGDQPSLLIGLIGWARTLGLPVVAAGKSSESDFVWDDEAGTVTAWERAADAPDFRNAFGDRNSEAQALLAARASLPFPRTTVPDLCEMGIVANHTGFMPDRPELHAPIARTIELPSLFRPASEGGLLSGAGRIDMFNCLRRPDELSFAGGVFVVVEAPDLQSGRLFAAKGMPASSDGRYVLLHNPVHLLGAEAPMSALLAALLGASTGGGDVRPRVDLVARTNRDMAVGETLAMGARHVIDGLDPLLVPARPLGPHQAVPYYLATNARIVRPVARGAILTGADVELPPDGVLLALRREQDVHFAADMVDV